MNAQELKDRTKQFALRVMHLVDALPNTPKGRGVASQLVRSGTSVAANYRAACRGRSHAEFIAKIVVVEEEAGETALWLELIVDDKLLPEKKIAPLLGRFHKCCSHRPVAGRPRADLYTKEDGPQGRGYSGHSFIQLALKEANELTAIMAASYISASGSKRDGWANPRSEIRNQQSEIRT